MVNLYRHFDRRGRLLYVGVSLSAFDRFLQHGKHAAEVTRMDVEAFALRRDALRAERKAIIEEGPLYNVQHAHAVPRPLKGNSMLSVRVPNRLLNALDETCGDGLFRNRTDAVVSMLSEGLRKRDMVDDEP